jgi:hypothetical protein
MRDLMLGFTARQWAQAFVGATLIVLGGWVLAVVALVGFGA